MRVYVCAREARDVRRVCACEHVRVRVCMCRCECGCGWWIVVESRVKITSFGRGGALKKALFSTKISTENKLDVRKTKMMVPTTNDQAHTPHPTEIKKCLVCNENRRLDHIRCGESKNDSPDDRRQKGEAGPSNRCY